MGVIYLLTNKINGKKYVGQSTYTMEDRWKRHLSSANSGNDKKGCPLLNNAIRKYGADEFTREVILECENELLNDEEIRLIKEHNSLKPNGYNISAGGQQSNHRPEDKEKISKALRKHTDFEMKTYMIRLKRGVSDGFIIRVPGKADFTFSNKVNGLQRNYELALECLDTINRGEVYVMNTDKWNEHLQMYLPQYLIYVKSANSFRVDKPGFKQRYFGSSKNTTDENLRLAKEYLETCK